MPNYPAPYQPTQLTGRRQRFAEEFVMDYDATAAARRAGYGAVSAPARGRQFLREPLVRDAISRAEKERCERMRINADRIRAEYATIAFANMGDYFTVDPITGFPRLDWRNLTRDQKAALSEVTVDVVGRKLEAVEHPDGEGEVAEMIEQEIVRVKFKHHPKLEALKALAVGAGLATEPPRDPNAAPPTIIIVHSNGREAPMVDVTPGANGHDAVTEVEPEEPADDYDERDPDGGVEPRSAVILDDFGRPIAPED